MKISFQLAEHQVVVLRERSAVGFVHGTNQLALGKVAGDIVTSFCSTVSQHWP
jgi:hypothetical protein